VQKLTFIGDVHGKIPAYRRLLLRFTEPTIQVGDMGIGFSKTIPLDEESPMDPKDRWFDGNHDDIEVCKKSPGYLGRYGVTQEGVFFAGGAFSVDSFFRTPGVDWWHTEQMNQYEMMEALQLYSDTKADIVATHDCPRSIYPIMLERRFGHTNVPFYENNTANLLDMMLDIRKPKVWVFGHWHRHMDFEYKGVRFVCVDELQPITLEF